jgi:hypothetical protein
VERSRPSRPLRQSAAVSLEVDEGRAARPTSSKWGRAARKNERVDAKRPPVVIVGANGQSEATSQQSIQLVIEKCGTIRRLSGGKTSEVSQMKAYRQ